MNDSAHSVYLTWARSSSVSPEILERIYSVADRTGNVEVLKALAGRRDLPADLDERIVERNELEVLLAWTRRNLDNIDVVVQRVLKDKRATLKLELAALADLPVEVYDAIAKSNSKKAILALVANGSVPDDSLKPYAELIVSAVNGEHSGTSSLADTVIKSRPWLTKTMIASTTSLTALLIAASRGTPDDEDLTLAAKRLIQRLSSLTQYPMVSLVNEFTSKTLPDTALEALSVVLQEPDKASRYDYYRRNAIEAIGKAVGRRGFDGDSLIDSLQSATDDFASVYSVARAAVVDEKLTARQLADAVWTNPVTPAEILRETLPDAARQNVRERVLQMESEGKFDDVILMLSHRYGMSVDIDSLRNPEAIVERVAATTNGSLPNWVIHTNVFRQNTEWTLKYQPAIVALTEAKTVDLARNIVAARLTTPVQWETFDGLVGEFSGTLDDLLAAVDSLAA